MPRGFASYGDMNEQWEIERSLVPASRWLGAAHLVQRLNAEAAVWGAVRVAQRACRGWTDEDLWSLGDTLRRTLGAQLTALADQTNAYPGDGDWGTGGSGWREALRGHGAVLSRSPRCPPRRTGSRRTSVSGRGR